MKAFVASVALCRAALNRATSSPTGEMMLAYLGERFGAKGLERSVDLRLLRRFSNIAWFAPAVCCPRACRLLAV